MFSPTSCRASITVTLTWNVMINSRFSLIFWGLMTLYNIQFSDWRAFSYLVIDWSSRAGLHLYVRLGSVRQQSHTWIGAVRVYKTQPCARRCPCLLFDTLVVTAVTEAKEMVSTSGPPPMNMAWRSRFSVSRMAGSSGDEEKGNERGVDVSCFSQKKDWTGEHIGHTFY